MPPPWPYQMFPLRTQALISPLYISGISGYFIYYSRLRWRSRFPLDLTRSGGQTSERVWASVCIGWAGGGGVLRCATALPGGLGWGSPPPSRSRWDWRSAAPGGGWASLPPHLPSTKRNSGIRRGGPGPPGPLPAAGTRGERAALPSTMQRTSGPFPTPFACPGGRKGGGGGRGNDGEGGGRYLCSERGTNPL